MKQDKRGRTIRYVAGVRDSETDFRMLTKDAWKRIQKGDNTSCLTRRVEDAKLWRSEQEAWLAFFEFDLHRRGYSLFPIGIRKEG